MPLLQSMIHLGLLFNYQKFSEYLITRQQETTLYKAKHVCKITDKSKLDAKV